jgi:hypothetical protein
VNTIDLLTPIVYLLAFPSRHVLYLWDDYIRDAPAWFADANTGFVSLTEWADDGGEMVLGGLTPSGAKLAAQREEQGARAIAAFDAGPLSAGFARERKAWRRAASSTGCVWRGGSRSCAGRRGNGAEPRADREQIRALQRHSVCASNSTKTCAVASESLLTASPFRTISVGSP